ncbi:succinate dehydrogenase, hydrophobic membrane anchor protein [Pseudohalioglobus sediminis]|uniref:Succinate dehydrogenase hydrophobic membrane anchor subunit n=1 Tax=Pseudohalioglobus sediminis TaxID=2606449 RepID=A0A5B0WPK1_9GAMM|nr:succinate dehydrogenase, hydrophobic membrane anchor protein [Pseudohalioglobus sediminis]KAA1188131.1 succinate dehydrogenase, hydrophobic membrane anchor protein [Pseudohalioglobus sediminis]
MVRSVTSFGRSGLSDWLVQRVSGVILLAYFLYIGAALIGGVDYLAWREMFASTGMRVFTLLALLSLAAHAWIGMWAVSTDYMTERLMGPKGNVLRIAFQIACSLVIFVYVIWGIQILWG